MQAREIRQKFLEYFQGEGHTIVPSSSLLPGNDPTLLFTNAGMVQFKDVFLGREKLPFLRAVSSQKCLRVSGKHNDLEEVGKTARHNTFFEMLGNFSFGDYFKRDAIIFGWEFLTEVMGIPQDRLWATVFRDDDEAFCLWQELAGLPAGRIVRLGEKDNFWAMGETGPCGPCSEIVYDRGEEYRCDAPTCAIGQCDCDRWLELWNLVFMQFNRDISGKMTPLPKPSIDTGMGLERISSVLQGVDNIFKSDLLWPLIKTAEALSGREYADGDGGMPFRVIADHTRACTFLISDGVFPANEGRGYVLRRILRRAVRFGKVLGLNEPFLYRLAPVVHEIMGDAYPELTENMEHIQKVIQVEEERFGQTLDQGMAILESIIEETRARGRSTIEGNKAFVLYDTYGFPLDLTEDVAAEAGLDVDRVGFQEAMNEQRRRARQAWEENLDARMGGDYSDAVKGLSPTTFLGYDVLSASVRVLAIISEGHRCEEAEEGREVNLVLEATPFYAEAGGQVGDTGMLINESEGFRGRVTDTIRAAGGITLHRVTIEAGIARPGMELTAEVHLDRRLAIQRHHTATHLLHRSLRELIGSHVSQAGSLVAPDRLRFDFSHFEGLSPEQLADVENLVNLKILEDIPVTAFATSLEDAQAAGAMALFGEKYSDQVRVVRISDFSLELCAGTHVARTGQVGAFLILSESSIGSGIRRIEAVAGLAAIKHIRQVEKWLSETASTLRGSLPETPARARELVTRVKELEKENHLLSSRMATAAAQELLGQAVQVGDVKVIAARAPARDMETLRVMADTIRDRLGSGIIILGAPADDKVLFVTSVTSDLVGRGVHAGQIISRVARRAGGGGGGRPEMAQAGGKNPALLAEALDEGIQAVRESIAN